MVDFRPTLLRKQMLAGDEVCNIHTYISGKYEIEMEFTEYPDGSVTGTYKYPTNNTPIRLSGTYTIAYYC